MMDVKEYQNKVLELESSSEKTNFEKAILYSLNLIEESGKISKNFKNILYNEDLEKEKKINEIDIMQSNISDLLYEITCVCNLFDISLEDTLLKKIK